MTNRPNIHPHDKPRNHAEEIAAAVVEMQRRQEREEDRRIQFEMECY